MRSLLLSCLLILAAPARGDLVADNIMGIGNSLLWDTKPYDLDGNVTYDVYCGKTAEFIYANGLSATPEPACVTSSTPWTTALASQQFDYLIVQPHYDTLAGATQAISAWWQMQPDATLVIHEGWGGHEQHGNNPPHETQYHDGAVRASDSRANHSPAFFAALVDALRADPNNPTGEIRLTLTSTMVDTIYHDIAEGDAPYSDLSELYRDSIHMNGTDGRYLAHNALRLAMDQPISTVGFGASDPTHLAYLDGILTGVTAVAVPEASQLLALPLAALIALAARRRR